MEVFQSGWEDITLAEYQDILNIQRSNKGLFSRALETLCYLTDSDHWDNLDYYEILRVYSDISWIENHPINTNLVEQVGDFHLKPFTKLSLSEWIDLDSAIINSKYSDIVSILYRKVDKDKWGNVEYEPYKYSLSDRSNVSEDYPITKVIGAISSAYTYRENLLNVFAGLFDGYEEELTEEDREMLSPSEIREIENSIKKDNQKKNFAWQRILDDISGGVWSHIPDILDLPHTFVFNMRLSRKIYGD